MQINVLIESEQIVAECSIQIGKILIYNTGNDLANVINM